MQEQEKNLALLAQRYPLLITDLQKRIVADPQSAAAPTYPSETLFPERHGGQTLLDCYDPVQTLDTLNQLPEGESLLHLFATAGQFIIFISQPRAEQCINHLKWEPVLLPGIGESEHFAAWLKTHEPVTWPWIIDGRDYPMGNSQTEFENLSRHLIAVRSNNIKHYSQRITSQYENRPTPRAILEANDRPLRIMSVACIASSYQQFCARDMHEGLCEVDGVQSKLLIFSETPWNACEVLQNVIEFNPDVLVFNGNDRRQMQYLPDNLCIISWDQDHCMASQNYQQFAKPNDRLMVMVEEWKAQAVLNSVPRHIISHLNLGTNPDVYYPQPKEQNTSPQYDVLFVGNIYGFEEYKPMISFDDIAPEYQQVLIRARQLLDQWIDQQDAQSQYILPDSNELIDQAFREQQLPVITDPRIRLQIYYYFRYRIAHMLVRKKYLAALGDYKLGLFGKGWENIPEIANQEQGVIANGDDLRHAIYNSAIVLHLHTWTVHHPRLYDTAAAGGFLLVGRVPEKNEIETVYQPGEELDTFGSIAELKNKIDFYLENPQKRRTMAQCAARRTRDEHTMVSRMQQMVRTLKEDEQYLEQENTAEQAHSTVSAES